MCHLPDTSDHFAQVLRAINANRIVFFLGAGASLCSRPPDCTWDPESPYLPTGAELAGHLAARYGYPLADNDDLLRVSQYIAIQDGTGPLYEDLHTLFDTDFRVARLHEFLASLSREMRQRPRGTSPAKCPLFVTTNYDDLLERAFAAQGEEFDLVTYVAYGDNCGKFMHYPPNGDPKLIRQPNRYRELSLKTRAVILKVHGAVDRENGGRDSFVITEDHYIDYLTRTDIGNLMPVELAAKLRRSHFLFLGYSLRDWNLRVILHRVWGTSPLTYKSWAVQIRSSTVDRKFWENRGVDTVELDLETYVMKLDGLFSASLSRDGDHV